MPSKVEEVLEGQRKYYKSGATRSLKARKEILRKLRRALQTNENKLYSAIYADFKKSEFETYATELALVYHDIDEAVSKLDNWARKKHVTTNLLNQPASSYIVPEPLGLALVIGAWNYPYYLSLAPIVAAISAGCSVVLKPSELPERTSAVMARLINENFDAGLLHVIEGGLPEATELLHQKWDKIFFTGSSTVGKIVYKAAAENLTPVTLELGGKSPALVMASCDLSVTVKRLVWAKFLNAGQTCIAPDYVLVDKRIADEFIDRVKKEVSKANYDTANDNYVQIINERNMDRIAALISRNKVVLGGEVDNVLRTIQPTVLYPSSADDAAMQEEIFGPVWPIIPYDTLEDAYAVIAKSDKPLAAYIYSNKKSEVDMFMAKVSFGGGAVNDAVMHIVNSHLPFGGVGASGMGAYHGEEGFRSFSNYKSILDKPTWLEPNIKYSPYSKTKFKWIKRLFQWS